MNVMFMKQNFNFCQSFDFKSFQVSRGISYQLQISLLDFKLKKLSEWKAHNSHLLKKVF